MTPAQRKALEENPPDATTMAILVRRFAKILARQQHERNAAVNLDHVMTLLGAPKNRMIVTAGWRLCCETQHCNTLTDGQNSA